MATLRGEIHMNELDRFTAWLLQYGWQAQPLKGIYEKLRVRKDDKTMIFYKRMGSAHLSCALDNMHIYWVSRYRTDVRRQKRATQLLTKGGDDGKH